MILVGIGIIYLLTVAVFYRMHHDCQKTSELNAKGLTDLILRLENDRRIEREQNAAERQILLERIQRPEYPPPAQSENSEPTADPREMDMALVGAIVSEAPEINNV